ncbi:MAG: hypoxanthine phosphoribosyltransferase [Desulfovibrionaceae bacterium]|nr:hypoxanthine phosphoribosyltransferase [Desulfovibrionaceae bacterium]MBR5734565.1 hypoxanthine phosphoribosyltransferase [Desulfovibrionaceae bacterium]
MNVRNAALKPVLNAEIIQRRLDELAHEISAAYMGKPLVVICVLKGAFMFFTDLVKRLTCCPEIDFVRLSSYGAGTVHKEIVFSKDVEIPLRGKHVLVIEDMVDTGRSMEFLLKQLESRGALSLKLAVFIDKSERREVFVHPDFVAFSLPRGFLVGYGLDYAEQYRELPAVYEATILE